MEYSGFIYYSPTKAKTKKAPTITVYSTKGCSFNSATYRLLNEPKTVTILYHRAKKMIIIRSGEEDNYGAYPVTPNKNNIFVHKKDLSEIIFNEIMQNIWDKHAHAYKCVGKFDEEARGVVFNLNLSEELDEKKLGKRGNK